MTLLINTDGASRGNPGLASIGAICIVSEENKVLFKLNDRIGIQTNNIAEYTAVLRALEKVIELKLEKNKIILRADSALVVNQLNGVWKVKDSNIGVLFNKIKDMIYLNNLNITFQFVYRESNKEADRLANMALDGDIIVQNNNLQNKEEEESSILKKENLSIDNSFPALNKGVESLINSLNNLFLKENKNLKFKDFKKLKTNGIDSYSSLNQEELFKLINLRGIDNSKLFEIIDSLEEKFKNNDFVIRNNLVNNDLTKIKSSLYKWLARGLNPNLSIKKVLVDMEIEFNAKGF